MAKKINSLTKSVTQKKNKISKRQKDFLNRRPHRSFKLTRRRDYIRSWDISGYWSFTNEVRAVLWSEKFLFFKFILLYSTLSFFILGLLSQENYNLLDESVSSFGSDVLAGELTGVVQNIAIFAGVMTGAFTQNLSDVQIAYNGLLVVFGWLCVVWLLRQIVAKRKNIKLRDALYNCGAPIFSTFLISFVFLLQLVPFIVALLAYGSAYTTNILDNSLVSLAFWLVAFLLSVLSIYWLSSTIIALVVVTLPGIYPLKALKISGDIVTGRRLKILYRFAWLALTIVFVWAIVILPLLAISHLSLLKDVPIIPIATLLLSAFSLLWSSAYAYLLYRKLVSDESKPA